MTIGTTISSITVQGNGVTTSFAYPFLMPNAAFAVVTYTPNGGPQQVLTATEYTSTADAVSGLRGFDSPGIRLASKIHSGTCV